MTLSEVVESAGLDPAFELVRAMTLLAFDLVGRDRWFLHLRP